MKYRGSDPLTAGIVENRRSLCAGYRSPCESCDAIERDGISLRRIESRNSGLNHFSDRLDGFDADQLLIESAVKIGQPVGV